MRSGLPYRIVGGVRFYERKEIKDSLAYLKLLLNPHDDVSLRRVINVPARGIGRGVMDSLEAISANDAPPLLLASGLAVPAPDSLWTKLNRAVDERLVASRAATSLRTFRDSSRGCPKWLAAIFCRLRWERFSISLVICRTCAKTRAKIRRVASKI